MNKDKLQQELLAKIKPGMKPSDLKRPKKSIKPPKDEGYSSDENVANSPYLSSQSEVDKVQKADSSKNFADNEKKLLDQITSLKKQLQVYQDFKEADLKIKEKYKQEIKELQEQNNSLDKTLQELKNQNKTKEAGTQTENPLFLKNYSCQICFTNRKGGIPSQFLRVKGLGGERNKKIWVCFLCRKQVVVIYDEEENWRNF